MGIFDTSTIQSTGLTVTGKTILSGNSANAILSVSGATSQILSITDNISNTLLGVTTTGGTTHFSVTTGGTRIHTFLFDSSNSTGTTGQVLSTTPTGVIWINASGASSGTEVYVTGGTYSSGTATFRNNTGGTFTVTGFGVGGGSGGASITSFTYNNNVISITESSGSTLNVLINTVTGFTINGNLNVTGNSNIKALSATTGQFSGTGNNILLVKGSLNDLITVNDAVASSLFSVSTTGGSTQFSVTTGGTYVYSALTIGNGTVDGVAPETLNISAITNTSYNLVSAHGNVNNYLQLNIRNESSGTASSSDLVATNNTGTENSNYINMGINGSNFTTGIVGTANDAYLYSTGRELWIGNASSGSTGNVRIFAGDPATSTDVFISGASGFVGIGTNQPTARIHISGNAATNVMRIEGLNEGSGTDVVLCVDANGYVKEKNVGSMFLASDVVTSQTTITGTPLTFAIAANESYYVTVEGTCSKATSNTGLKFGIQAPAGCTIVGEQYGGGATLAATQVPSLISSINTLGTTLSTGIGVRVTFRLTFKVTNSSTAGNITLGMATVTSNPATLYAGARMTYMDTKSI